VFSGKLQEFFKEETHTSTALKQEIN